MLLNAGGSSLEALLPPLENRALLRLAPQFQAVVVRWEYHESNFLGMVQLACIVILLRR